MHGIQHLFRQHALEKQGSTESWHSAQDSISSKSSLQQTDYPNKSVNLESIDNSFQGNFSHLLFENQKLNIFTHF